jgi:phage gp36-like protein
VAQTRYASIDDLTAVGVNPDALKGISPTRVGAALDDASAEADGYLAAQYTLPLLVWGGDLKKKVAQLAAYDLIAARGRNPQGLDEDLRLRYQDAIKWLEGVRSGVITPTGISDSTPSQTAGTPGYEPVVVSSSQRGYSTRGVTPGLFPFSRTPFTSD